jgi:ribosomal protein L20
VVSVSELKVVRKEVLQMKKVLVIVMLIIAMGLVGCPRRYYERDRQDQDRGHDYEHRDRDNDDREHRR